MEIYDHIKTENKWKDIWYKDNVFEAVDFSEKPKKYILAEFPYPSGKALHAGHMMRFTVPDIYSRYLRMKGYNVLFPFGYDAFGLPAENYAIKTGIHPAVSTTDIVKQYKESVLHMGYGIDWNREICTTDPLYYKWTQWIFLKLFKEGLAEYKQMPIWWCEGLKTVLADEEVLTDKDGNKISERGEMPVVRKLLSQWVLKITKYADKLLDGLKTVDFTESIKTAQTNWIGKSEGAYVDFFSGEQAIRVFTTRPDTLFGVTFLALSADYSGLPSLLEQCTNKNDVLDFINKIKNQTDLEKQTNKIKDGIEIKGVAVKHPLSEITDEIPIFVTNYVLTDYGTGAVMGVPGHDERDFEFAKKYNLKITYVITPIKSTPETNSSDSLIDTRKGLFTGSGEMINSGKYNGMRSEDFFDAVIERLESEGKGAKATTYKLRDWIFSRQRYWGEPIPLLHNQDGTIEAICDPDIPEEVKTSLPLTLPELPDYSPTSDGASPLEKNTQWVNTKNKNGNPAKRETNTMPNWAGSCWYFIRYIDPHNDARFADMEKLKYWLPVDRYFGGAEHTTMHLLYSRFWYRFLYDMKLVPTEEPYAWRLNGGLLLGPDGKKMSKSKGNVVEPMNLIEKYGADALRLCISFIGPYEDTYPWNENGMKATSRLINNIFELSQKVTSDNDYTVPEDLNISYNNLIKNVTGMCESLKMNTAVSELMIFINETKKYESIGTDMWNGFVRLIAPFAPFIAEELWQSTVVKTGWKKENSVHLQSFPTYDESALNIKMLRIPIQINGKIRAEIEITTGESQDSVIQKAMVNENVTKYLDGKTPVKTVYVPNKIVSIAV